MEAVGVPVTLAHDICPAFKRFLENHYVPENEAGFTRDYVIRRESDFLTGLTEAKKDPNLDPYKWFLNEDGAECVVNLMERKGQVTDHRHLPDVVTRLTNAVSCLNTDGLWDNMEYPSLKTFPLPPFPLIADQFVRSEKVTINGKEWIFITCKNSKKQELLWPTINMFPALAQFGFRYHDGTNNKKLRSFLSKWTHSSAVVVLKYLIRKKGDNTGTLPQIHNQSAANGIRPRAGELVDSTGSQSIINVSGTSSAIAELFRYNTGDNGVGDNRPGDRLHGTHFHDLWQSNKKLALYDSLFDDAPNLHSIEINTLCDAEKDIFEALGFGNSGGLLLPHYMSEDETVNGGSALVSSKMGVQGGSLRSFVVFLGENNLALEDEFSDVHLSVLLKYLLNDAGYENCYSVHLANDNGDSSCFFVCTPTPQDALSPLSDLLTMLVKFFEPDNSPQLASLTLERHAAGTTDDIGSDSTLQITKGCLENLVGNLSSEIVLKRWFISIPLQQAMCQGNTNDTKLCLEACAFQGPQGGGNGFLSVTENCHPKGTWTFKDCAPNAELLTSSDLKDHLKFLNLKIDYICEDLSFKQKKALKELSEACKEEEGAYPGLEVKTKGCKCHKCCLSVI